MTTSMTAEAKSELGPVIRGLRDYLLEHLGDAARSDYQLDIPRLDKTSLGAAQRERRRRLEGLGESPAELVKRAAYTVINRLVVIKLMEGLGLRRDKLVTGGTESRAYRDFKALAPAIESVDDSEGYALLLDLLFRELAVELPGLFGDHGAAAALRLIRVPGYVLREVIKRLDTRALESCWHDDMTLGWVYQYWNDPEREALDAKLNRREKLEATDIASKTQMFTERYMVDWLLQNSLGPLWLAMCQKHGWTAEASGLIARLDTRRAEFRVRRERGEVPLTELMPVNPDEARWAYYVPQPIPADAVANAPESLDTLKLLDPAVGSGHFLVVAFDLLFALHQEEDRHRGRRRSDAAIAEHILEHNLHGIDLDPRAVQIAAAALWIKARTLARDAHPKSMHLVSAQLRLGDLHKDDPALVALRQAVLAETNIPAALTDEIVAALKGADWIGSLLKVERAVDDAITTFESKGRLPLGDHGGTSRDPKQSVLTLLEGFLARKTSTSDLGLRLRGEQLASGVRLVRMLREGQYDIVVGNPPYLGTNKLKDASAYKRAYPMAGHELFAGFFLRAFDLLRPSGVFAFITLSNWMFLRAYSQMRAVVAEHRLVAILDLGKAAFTTGGTLISTSCTIAANVKADDLTPAFRLTGGEREMRDSEQPYRLASATLAQVGRHEFRASDLRVVPEWPLVYWWPRSTISSFENGATIGDVCPARKGLDTGDNTRHVRMAFEVISGPTWSPFVQGAKGRAWVEPALYVLQWRLDGLQVRIAAEHSTGANIRNDRFYFRIGVAFSLIGASFSARVHRIPSVIAGKGSSLFPVNLASTVCLLNSTRARRILADLNPGIGFEVGDVNRLPLLPVADADSIVATLDAAFTVHESHREPSVEYRRPGPSPWRHAQAWAQLAVDRPEGAPLPPYVEALDPEPATDHLSYALGVALGRFHPDGQGILDPTTADLSHALPHGLLFLDGSLADNEHADSLGHPACQPLLDAWATHRSAIARTSSLRAWLTDKFFAVHKSMYDNRPIHWPLCSEKKTFVVWLTIHRMDASTLSHVLADHLVPRQRELDGLVSDLIAARQTGDARQKRAAEDRYAKLDKARQELDRFIELVRQLDTRGPDGRAVDARYDPDLDDGVMINSAALWPLLEPLWKDPKKWWKELAAASGKKDYDWSHLAMRYFPERVDAKCQNDPSLGVAHHCFWHYHPARAFAWELRLQDELAPDFRITEPPYRGGPGDAALRQAFLAEQPDAALAAIEKEALRRRRKTKAPVPSMTLLDPGLWTTHPAAVYALELQLSERQGQEFQLHAPDEARTPYESQHPAAAAERRQRLASLQSSPQSGLDLDPDDAEPDDPTDDEPTESGDDD